MIRFNVILCFSALITFYSYCQCPSLSDFGSNWVQGRIIINGSQVGTQCTGRPLNMINPNEISNIKYIYSYKNKNDTLFATSATNYTYNNSGPYYIVQIGIINGKPSLACGLIIVYDTPKPTFTIANSCDDLASININRNAIYGQYIIDWGDGSVPQNIGNNQQATYKYQNPGTYQIRIRGEGTANLIGCNNTSDPQTFQANPAALPISQAVATVADNRWPSVTVALPKASIQAKNYAFSGNGINLVRAKNTLTDSSANATEQSFCYQVSYTDACNRMPMNNPTVCTIHLQAGEEQLQWSGQSPFVQSVQAYTVERLDANGQVLRAYIIGTGTQWTIDPNDPDQEVYYRVRAVSVMGQVSVSNIVRIVRGVQLLVPDVFSPNNDQMNDTFEIKGQYIKQASINIYDRWGTIVYFSKDWRKSWDGTSKEGQQLPNGVYTYHIEAVDVKDNAFVKRGAVFLVR